MHHPRSAFTLIELLVVIAIIAILSVVVVLTLNPSELLKQSRDANRMADFSNITEGLGLYQDDQAGSLGTASTTYVSIPDPLATSTLGDQCQGLGLPPLPTGYSYHCVASSSLKNLDGTGWIPVNFTSASFNPPLATLPVDPINQTSSNLFYTYTTNGTQYELASIFESQKDVPLMSQDGGAYDGLWQEGTRLNMTPPLRGYYLSGYWPFTEGTGTVVYDFSDNKNNGIWNGTPGGTSGYYSGGKVGAWAGTFSGTISNYVSIPSLPMGASMSISAWINASSVPSGYAAIFANSFAGGLFIIPSGNLYLQVCNASTCSNINAPSVVPGTWQYLVGVLNSSSGTTTLTLYLNGKAIVSSVTSITSLITTSASVGVNQFAGLLNDLRIYNHALNPAEIQAVYNAEK